MKQLASALAEHNEILLLTDTLSVAEPLLLQVPHSPQKPGFLNGNLEGSEMLQKEFD